MKQKVSKNAVRRRKTLRQFATVRKQKNRRQSMFEYVTTPAKQQPDLVGLYGGVRSDVRYPISPFYDKDQMVYSVRSTGYSPHSAITVYKSDDLLATCIIPVTLTTLECKNIADAMAKMYNLGVTAHREIQPTEQHV